MLIHTKIISYILYIFLLMASTPSIADDNNFPQEFIDPNDGYLDLSEWLLNKQGFLPVPISITEPALGYGGGLGALYFHAKPDSDQHTKSRTVMPSISGVGGAKTDNGSWFVGAGHLGIWQQDTIRYTGIIAKTKFNMDYYGLSSKLPNDMKQGITFEADALFLLQEILFRVPNTDIFAGVAYNIYDSKNDFSTDLQTNTNQQFLSFYTPEIPSINFDSKVASVNLIMNYDTRSNMLTPSNGTYMKFKAMFFDDAFGSDKTFERYSALFTYHKQIQPNLVVGFLSSAKKVSGDAPFYAYPYIDMRGVKTLQYQGDEVLLSETEVRYSVTPRWAVIGFAGVGKAFNDTPKGNSANIYSRGVGLRYLIASKLGLQMGFDIAKGPEDTAFYIQVGSAWAIR